ncbi:hypothetical protein CPB86DRAFT_784326 [Serendipita vermifera]|nr:hypothetical protein CPB86DRAFT_784326 [Serendipita vermifera]
MSDPTLNSADPAPELEDKNEPRTEIQINEGQPSEEKAQPSIEQGGENNKVTAPDEDESDDGDEPNRPLKMGAQKGRSNGGSSKGGAKPGPKPSGSR